MRLPDLARAPDRMATRTTLDQWLVGTTRQWDAGDLAERLVGAGVPASVVITPPLVIDNPQIRHRGLFETEDHPVTSRHQRAGASLLHFGHRRWVRTLGTVARRAQRRGPERARRRRGANGSALRDLKVIGEELVGA